MLLFAGLDALSTLARLHREEQSAQRDFLARHQCLMGFRATLENYGSRIDEYFLERNSDVQVGAARDFAELERQIRSSLRTYPPDRTPQEVDFFRRVAKTLAEQEAILNSAMSEDRHDDPERISRRLYAEAVPRNRRLIEEANKIELWNHDRLDRANGANLQMFAALQEHLMRMMVIMLSSGLLLAFGSIVYILQQDREARKGYSELVVNREELSKLPSSLLDAQEQERRSISRELHDEVGQLLGALLVDLGRLKAVIPPGNTAAEEQIIKIRSAAESAVGAVRNIALLLRPSMLDDLGLIAAIEWQGREVSRRTDMEVEVDSSGVSDDLREEYKICIYRVTQEALHNAARHSGGKHAWVRIEQTRERIVLTIRDDGHGFDPARTRGLGLLGMEERARRLGGRLDIRSKAGEGTTLKLELPLAGRI